MMRAIVSIAILCVAVLSANAGEAKYVKVDDKVYQVPDLGDEPYPELQVVSAGQTGWFGRFKVLAIKGDDEMVISRIYTRAIGFRDETVQSRQKIRVKGYQSKGYRAGQVSSEGRTFTIVILASTGENDFLAVSLAVAKAGVSKEQAEK